MSNYVSALGVCQKCGRDKIQAADEIKCVFCDFDTTVPKGPTVNIEDPGEEEINRVLAASGVRVDLTKKVEGKKNEQKAQEIKSAPQVVAAVTVVDFSEQIKTVLTIMEHLPMPKDMKQVKLVYKVIGDLNKILGV